MPRMSTDLKKYIGQQVLAGNLTIQQACSQGVTKSTVYRIIDELKQTGDVAPPKKSSGRKVKMPTQAYDFIFKLYKNKPASMTAADVAKQVEDKFGCKVSSTTITRTIRARSKEKRAAKKAAKSGNQNDGDMMDESGLLEGDASLTGDQLQRDIATITSNSAIAGSSQANSSAKKQRASKAADAKAMAAVRAAAMAVAAAAESSAAAQHDTAAAAAAAQDAAAISASWPPDSTVERMLVKSGFPLWILERLEPFGIVRMDQLKEFLESREYNEDRIRAELGGEPWVPAALLGICKLFRGLTGETSYHGEASGSGMGAMGDDDDEELPLAHTVHSGRGTTNQHLPPPPPPPAAPMPEE